MNPGDVFNPSQCGFEPAAVVDARHDLSDGPKRAYSRLVRLIDDSSSCSPSQEELAQLLGKSVRQVRDDLKALESAGLIARRSRGARQSRAYEFRWHEMFHVAEAGATKLLEFPKAQTGTPPPPTAVDAKPDDRNSPAGHEAAPCDRQDTAAQALSAQDQQEPVDVWLRAGWFSQDSFDMWFRRWAWEHPQRKRETAAKAKALEMLQAGTLIRAEFERTYAAVSAAAGPSWNPEHAPDLLECFEGYDELLRSNENKGVAMNREERNAVEDGGATLAR